MVSSANRPVRVSVTWPRNRLRGLITKVQQANANHEQDYSQQLRACHNVSLRDCLLSSRRSVPYPDVIVGYRSVTFCFLPDSLTGIFEILAKARHGVAAGEASTKHKGQ